MRFDISHQPSYAIVDAHMEPGELIRAEGGAMVSMDAGVTVETKARGGFLKSLGRSVLGGESFFLNTFRTDSGGTIRLAPSLPGDMMVMEVSADAPVMVQSGAYIAATEGLEVETKWSGAKTFFASEGAVMLRVVGTGQLVIASFGALDEWTLAEGETYTVDTGHLVTMTEGIGFDVRKVGGWKSTLFSGEGLVVDLTGPGTFTTQTRSQDAFLSWLIPRLPSSNTSSA
jgi:uncharacterized protein (TIGR00266 family)